MGLGNIKGVAVTVKFDERQVERARVELAGISNGLSKALAGAINKVLTKGRTEVVRGLSETLAVKPSRIRQTPGGTERISIRRAMPSKLEGFIKILARPIGLINFKIKEKRKKKGRKYGAVYPGEGIFGQVYKSGPAFRLKHAFIAKGRSGNVHVFQRTRKGSKYVARQPIEALKGPSLLTVYREHPELHERTERRIADELAKELDSQINRFLKRSKA